jgi:hypothetical protein
LGALGWWWKYNKADNKLIDYGSRKRPTGFDVGVGAGLE